MQIKINSGMEKSGFREKGYTAHTLQHSFATPLLNRSNNIHVIKTLLDHSKLETTMVYLHLQKHSQLGIRTPLEFVSDDPKSL